jgi:hypothetical protein
VLSNNLATTPAHSVSTNTRENPAERSAHPLSDHACHVFSAHVSYSRARSQHRATMADRFLILSNPRNELN